MSSDATPPVNTGPRTINDLGMDAHNAYAIGKEYGTIPNLGPESTLVGKSTEINTFSPTYGTFEQLFGLGSLNRPVAMFTPPGDFLTNQSQIFSSYSLIPSIGNEESYLAYRKRVDTTKEKNKKEKAKKDKLLAFLDDLHFFNRIFNQIQGNIRQYHKG